MNQELILRKTAQDNRELFSNPKAIIDTAMEFQQLLMLYESGIKQIVTKFEILEDEFQSKHERNPIETITSRIKEPMSIAEKLQRKGLSLTIDNMVNKLYDIAGIRVTCPFISDVYRVTQMLLKQDDITLIELKDYIKHPKESGYRSLHVIVKVGVYFSDQKREIPVEIQIRTIAMDFWASLEHQLHYKKDYAMPANISKELHAIAETIALNDERMQNLAKNIPGFTVCNDVEESLS
ncbi:MAG: GTP pyrophosphokinase family protein [Treponema sp.]|nr:GTP pyrophosphokinase family protein [Treponema sp.]MBP5748222.1 GTP pyrophosphokinase family protein [Treponema sp.]MBR4387033.1 GTP pyrophosphokinase family protein [Treponema sp.]